MPEATQPPIDGLIDGRPTRWIGLPVTWLNELAPNPVFLASFECCDAPASEESLPVHLYAAAYDLTEARVGGDTLGPGYFTEYFVVEQVSSATRRAHRLVQQRSITFSPLDEPDDFLPARQVDQTALSVEQTPRWKPEEAVWPTHDGSPMLFIGQVRLRETKSPEDWLRTGVVAYLFWDGVDVYKIVEQDLDEQSAAEHYAEEDADV